MGIRTTDPDHVALYDSVSGCAFGETFESDRHANHFLQWCDVIRPGDDPRAWSAETFTARHEVWWEAYVDPDSGDLLDGAWDELEELKDSDEAARIGRETEA